MEGIDRQVRDRFLLPLALLSFSYLLFIENEEEKDKNARITDPFLLHLLMRLKKRSSDSVLASSFLFFVPFVGNEKRKRRKIRP